MKRGYKSIKPLTTLDHRYSCLFKKYVLIKIPLAEGLET